MLWEIDIYPAPGQPDRLAQQVAADARDLGFAQNLNVTAASGYLIQGELEESQIRSTMGNLGMVGESAAIMSVFRSVIMVQRCE